MAELEISILVADADNLQPRSFSAAPSARRVDVVDLSGASRNFGASRHEPLPMPDVPRGELGSCVTLVLGMHWASHSEADTRRDS